MTLDDLEATTRTSRAALGINLRSHLLWTLHR